MREMACKAMSRGATNPARNDGTQRMPARCQWPAAPSQLIDLSSKSLTLKAKSRRIDFRHVSPLADISESQTGSFD